MLLLQIDDREHAVNAELLNVKTKKPVIVKTCRLQIGDFIVSYNGQLIAIIERKTLADLSASIRDGRITSQVANMVAAAKDPNNCKNFSPKLIIILEGSLAGARNSSLEINGIPVSNLYTKCDHLMMRDGIHIIETLNTADTATRLMELISNFPIDCISGGNDNKETAVMTTVTAVSTSSITTSSASSETTMSTSSTASSTENNIVLTKKELTKSERIHKLFMAIPRVGNILATSLMQKKVSIAALFIKPETFSDLLPNQVKQSIKSLSTLEKILVQIPRCSKAKAKKIVQTLPVIANWSVDVLSNVAVCGKSGKEKKIGKALAKKILEQIQETL